MQKTSFLFMFFLYTAIFKLVKCLTFEILPQFTNLRKIKCPNIKVQHCNSVNLYSDNYLQGFLHFLWVKHKSNIFEIQVQ